MITLFVTSIAMLFAVSSQAPGVKELTFNLVPCNFAFARAFNISSQQATFLTIIPTVATGFGFVFAYQRQLYAMAGSGMLPVCFTWKLPKTDMPYVGLLFGTVLSLLIVLPIYYVYTSFVEDLFFWCSLASYFVYSSTFLSFIELRRKFSVLARSYVNPFGIPSAIIGWLIFTMNFISVIGFQGEEEAIQHRFHPIAGFFICLLLALLWYFGYAQKRQCFSVEEQTLMFSAYVIKG